jgi:hypothetical protein
MARPIAYNASGPLSGSIRGGNVNYTVDSGNRDYTTFASKKWVPSADGAAPIVFVTDTYTQGFELNPSLAVPLFYSCNGTGSAAIIYTANRIPGSPGNYSDANVALNDLINARGYFILESNDPYQGDFQSGNLVTLDASKMSSYPQTGTNFYDLSGNDFDFSLLNGPTFNSSGWFNMDGTDDSIGLAGNTTLKTTSTLVMWLRTTDTTGLLLTGNPPGTTGGEYIAAYYPGVGFYSGVSVGAYFMDTLPTNNPATPINYLDGRFHMWEVKGINFGAWTNDWYFLSYAAGYQIAGDVSKIQMFNSYLTAAQSKQLYFGAPIVTDGLVFAVDANNIVSYPKSGTAWYQLTGSANNGTLTNGPTFKANNGGVISLDGTDDFINFGSVNFETSDSITLDMWVYPQSATQEAYADIFDANHSGLGFVLQQDYLTYNYYYFAYWDGSGFQVTSNIYIDPYVWSHIVITKEGNNGKIYKNGQLVVSNTFTNPSLQGTNTLYLGKFVIGGRQWKGEYGNFKGYNRALTAAEVQQNYQAEQYRFETPAGIPTSGLVMNLDASNLDSYSGTGTTWYDLTGNGNNVSLINDPTYVGNSFGGYFSNDVDSYFSGVGTGTIPTGNNSYTMLVWARQTVSGGWGDKGFISIGGFGSTNQSNALRTYNNTVGYFAHYWWGNDILLSNNNAGLSLGTWFLAAATFDGTTRRIWINGVSQASDTPVGHNVTSTTIQVSKTFGSEYQVGDMAVARIYNRALTSDEMLQTYNAEKTRFGL